jgi:hypothetical protein
MSQLHKFLYREWNPEARAGRQTRVEQNRAVPDRCGSKPGAPDAAPPLVSRIATSFWCQPTVRDSDDRQQANRDAQPAKGRTTMPTKTEQCVALLALSLALAAAAAILSAPDRPRKMHQISQWLTVSTAPEAAAVAGAIGENPDVLQAP